MELGLSNAVDIVLSISNENSHLGRLCSTALRLISNTIAAHSNDVSVSFNGGKDSIAVLLLTLAAERRLSAAPVPLWRVDTEPELPEVEHFAHAFAERANRELSVYTDHNTDIPTYDRFRSLVLAGARAHGRWVLMGVRSSDLPLAAAAAAEVVEGYGGAVMRVQPVMSWKLADVLELILRCGIELPRPYLVGYASCGPAQHSRPHPLLRRETVVTGHRVVSILADRGVTVPPIENNACQYLPIWFLPENSDERGGRE